MLQASHPEDFVKNAVIAIGALHTCGRRLMESKHSKVTSGIAVTPRYRFALRQWGLASTKMQKRISGDEKGLRMALIACLLVVCFENLQGNYFQGLKHAVSGHTLLQAWLDRQDLPMSRKEGLESPSPHIIAFSRLDLQIMAYVDPHGASTHQAPKNSGTAVVGSMSVMFNSIEEARRYWELIQRRSSHFIATIATMAQAEGNMQELTKVGVGTETVTCYSESTIMLPLSPSQDQDARR